jgi:biopolymer transport protein ExbD
MNLRPHRRRVPIIPIVSMIDILVILLIFFIATTTFRPAQKIHVKIVLPKAEALGESEARPEVRVSLSVTKDEKVFLDGEAVAIEKLTEALNAFRQSRPEAKLELQIDRGTPFEFPMRVLGALRAANYADVPTRIERPAGGVP